MKKIVRLDPEHAEALNFLGYSWAENNENLDKAHGYLQKANRLKPENGFILDSLGWVLFRMKKYNEAITTLIKAQALIPENSLVCEHIGDVYRAMGNTDKADKWYLDAVKKAKTDKKRDEIKQKITGNINDKESQNDN